MPSSRPQSLPYSAGTSCLPALNISPSASARPWGCLYRLAVAEPTTQGFSSTMFNANVNVCTKIVYFYCRFWLQVYEWMRLENDTSVVGKREALESMLLTFPVYKKGMPYSFTDYVGLLPQKVFEFPAKKWTSGLFIVGYKSESTKN